MMDLLVLLQPKPIVILLKIIMEYVIVVLSKAVTTLANIAVPTAQKLEYMAAQPHSPSTRRLPR